MLLVALSGGGAVGGSGLVAATLLAALSGGGISTVALRSAVAAIFRRRCIGSCDLRW